MVLTLVGLGTCWHLTDGRFLGSVLFSLFEKPLKNIDTIYSPRKFFGVSDGGYLYMNHFPQIHMS